MGMSGVTSTGSSLIANGGRLMTFPSHELYREIPLTQGQFATVDADNYEWLSQFKWSARWAKNTRSYYAIRNS